MPCSDCSPTFSALKELNECKLLNRVRSNQAPVASERAKFTELISQAEKDLVDYEETIARLQEMIVALKNEQRGLNRQVCLAKSLTAPIRKLPPEVLHQIFLAHGSTNIIRLDKSATSRVPGFQIASICSHWRSIATTDPMLWKDISVEIGSDTHYDSRLPVTERLLQLSQKSLLSICIHIKSPTRAVIFTIPMFSLLCAHANRWERLEVAYNTDLPKGFQAIVDTLASIHGRLDSLHTFEVRAPFQQCGAWVEGAPKLQRLLVRGIDSNSTAIPWSQIVDLVDQQPRVLHIAESLEKMPNLSSLEVAYFWRKTGDGTKAVSHFNLESLKIVIADDTDEGEMGMLFELLTLPRLQFLSIETREDYLTSQNDLTWSSMELPSLISRSSAFITSFTLKRVWMHTSDLISVLRSMPALSSLSLLELSCEDSDINPMINDQFLSSMHMQHQDQQPILTRLTSLNLEISSRASFSMPTFVEMIHSRWKPVQLDDDEVACIKEVELYAPDSVIDRNTIYSLLVLRKRGLDITIEDEERVFISANVE